jgi:phosphatidylinositol-4,5-bisphosphate 4-phosphatase
MSLEISAFRSAQGNRLTLDQAQHPTGVIKAELPFGDRVVNFFKTGDARYGTAQQQQDNRDFKTNFRTALIKAEGVHIANRAARSAGLPPGWQNSAKPMSEKTVKLVLEKAQQFRKEAVDQTEHNIGAFLRRTTPPSFTSTFQGGINLGFTNLPVTDADNETLHALFRREVRQDPHFATRTLDATDMQNIAARAIAKFELQKQNAFREQHPGLAQYVNAGHAGTPREDQRSFVQEMLPKFSTTTAQGHPLSTEPVQFRSLAQDALVAISHNGELLSEMRYDPEGWQEFGDELVAAHDRLSRLEVALSQLAGPNAPNTQEGQDLFQALTTELRHQQGLLLAKASFIDDLQENDPLGQKTVDYSNLLWAHAAGKIFDQAIAGTQDQATIARLTLAKTSFIDMQQQIYDNSQPGPRTNLPGTISKDQHPATLGKNTAKQYLTTFLTQAGIPRDTIRELTSSENLGSARRQALNENQDWAPIRRDMVVHRDGVTRTYQSRITPGNAINPRFGRLYGANQGISSATKDDQTHARNLKVSELVRMLPGQQEESRIKLIGHGVLDMWDIQNPGQRHTANVNGAHEVLEAAISVNDRIRTEALNRVQAGDNRPVKITHVSVNLITPAGWRELPGMEGTKKLHDYQEQTYTLEQFNAFHENSTAHTGGPIQFHVDDDRTPGHGVVLAGNDTPINVEVDVISFSFGINPMATGRAPDWVGGWASVYDHNRGMMEKFVGDLGEGEFGAFGSRPGGFIGEVMDGLDMNNPAHRELATRMQEQADLVRSMFTHEDFKRGNGDPAKMGRHILALQGLAEEALAIGNVVDHAATMSKGCKSDKDRGGVTDTELKHQIITEDMGGEIRPDARLEGDDQQNYYVIASSSGQLENQVYNTGLGGSKEAGKLGTRIPDTIVRQYLSGLGAFASE